MQEKQDKDASIRQDPPAQLESLAEKLRLGKLDLEVEEVEERISPSETNVFDK